MAQKTQDDINDLNEKIVEAHAKAGILTEQEQIRIKERQDKVIKKSASAGVEFAGAIIGCTFLGIWIDKQTDTAPIFMMIFIILGAVVAFYNLYRTSENLSSVTKVSNSQLHSDKKNVKKTPITDES